jgi:hypothetical protein
LRVARFARPAPLEPWCAERGIGEAIVGGIKLAGGRPVATALLITSR